MPRYERLDDYPGRRPRIDADIKRTKPILPLSAEQTRMGIGAMTPADRGAYGASLVAELKARRVRETE